MKKILILVLVALAAAGGGWWWWNRQAPVDTGHLVLQGNVDIRQVSLAFDGSGRIADLRVEEGDSVKAGDVLGHLDTRTLLLQARQAEAQVDAARQALLKLQNGARPEEIAQARAQLASAEAAALRADQDYSRATRLLATASSAVSQQNVDQTRAAADVARAGVEGARAALELTEAGARSEDIAGAAAQVKGAEASLALIRHQIGEGELRAPVNAVVRARLHEPGDMVTPAAPVLALALTRPKWIRVYVSEPDLGHIRPGLAARVFTDSAPEDPVAGAVGYISSVAEFTPKSVQTEELRTSLVYEVRVIVDDGADALRAGQPVTVRFDPEPAK